MATIFNPYDTTLNLTNKDDRKLLLDACTGLSGKDRYDGEEEGYLGFMKVMAKSFRDVRVMEVLKVAIAWDDDGADVIAQRFVIGEFNLFERHGIK